MIRRLGGSSCIGTDLKFCYEVCKYFMNLFCTVGRLNHTSDELHEQVRSTSAMYASLLRSCGDPMALDELKEIHAHMVGNGFSKDVFLGNILVDMYGRCGSLYDAEVVFDKLHRRNVFSWNAMIGAYIRDGKLVEALRSFNEMLLEFVKPDKFTFSIILAACVGLECLQDGKRIHKLIIDSGLETNIVVATSLLNMYGKCKSPEDAAMLFKRLTNRDVICWNAMIAAYAQNGLAMEALKTFKQMILMGLKPDRATFLCTLDACISSTLLVQGILVHALVIKYGFENDIAVGNSLIHMYGKCSCPELAGAAFEKMCNKNVVSWTTIIAAYTQSGFPMEALKLFRRMISGGWVPNEITFVNGIDACAEIPSISEGVLMHARVLEIGLEANVVAVTALLNLYVKCGNLQGSFALLNKMQLQNTVSWNVMIAACAQNGYVAEVLNLLNRMLRHGVCPDKYTFITFLSMCSHTGLLSEGHNYFIAVSGDFRQNPTMEHCGCVVDLLGRAGQVDEGVDFLESLPFESNSTMWTTLLSACAILSDVKWGSYAAKLASDLEPDSIVPQIMLSNLYAAVARWDDARKVRVMLEEKIIRRCKREHSKLNGESTNMDAITLHCRQSIDNSQEQRSLLSPR